MKSTLDIYFDTYVCPNFIYDIYEVVCTNICYVTSLMPVAYVNLLVSNTVHVTYMVLYHTDIHMRE